VRNSLVQIVLLREGYFPQKGAITIGSSSEAYISLPEPITFNIFGLGNCDPAPAVDVVGM